MFQLGVHSYKFVYVSMYTYMGMCNGGSAQQESGAGLSKNSMFTAGAKNYIQLLY